MAEEAQEGQIEDTSIGCTTQEIDFVNLFELKIKEHSLSEILEGFKNVNMTINDILYCNEDDIRDIIKSSPAIKISPIERVKFIRIVISIKEMKERKGTIINLSKKSNDSYLRRMIHLNDDNEIDGKRIIEFVDNNKQQDLERILEIIEDETNNVNFKRILDFVDAYQESIDIHRVFEMGYDAMIAYEKIHELNNKKVITLDKGEYINAVRNNINQQKNELNEECEWLKNQIDILHNIAVQQIEFNGVLTIRDINQYLPIDCKKEAEILLNQYLEYIETQNIDKVKAISAKIDHINKLRKKPSKNSSTLSFDKDLINYLWTLTPEPIITDLSTLFKGVSLKCQEINGSIVSLEWTKPWQDPENATLTKLIELKLFKEKKFSFIVEYTEDDDDEKHEDMKWQQIILRNKNKSLFECGNKCQIFLLCNKTYKIRIKYVYVDYVRGSAFSSIISIKTEPRLEAIEEYEPLWSDTFISKEDMTLSQDSTIVTNTECWKSVRAKFEIKKGTITMWEFELSNNSDDNDYDDDDTDHSDDSDDECGLDSDTIFGVYCQKATDDDGKETDNAFQAKTLDDLRGICTNTMSDYWVDLFDISAKGVNNVKIIADYTHEKCILTFVVNRLVPTIKEKPYVLELDTLAEGESIYPAIQLYHTCSCKIQSVSL